MDHRHDKRDNHDDHGARPMDTVIVGGLHADARRAAVEHLLATVPDSVALHHDLSTAVRGTVVRTVRDTTGMLSTGDAPLVNDCACCALREDLVPELERLADGGLTRLAIVELWDSVEPKAMAEVIAAHGGEGLRLSGVVTAVDPALLMPCLGNGDDLMEAGLAAAPTDQRTVADTWARQLEYAPVLAVAHSPEADDEDRALLAQLHPTARQVPIGHGDLAGAVLAGFDVEAAAAAQHPSCALLPVEADAAGVSTFVWHRERPFHPGRLYDALEDLTCAAARSRGRFWLADIRTPCSAGTRRAARSVWSPPGPGWPRCRTPHGRWCRRCAARPPPSTGIRSTATAATTWCSPRPAWTARVSKRCLSPAC
jgi:G3E family GTPase